MKLLFDENLAPRLAESLSDLYPGSDHVHDCNLGGADDDAVWEYAKARGFTIVSKDSDFTERSVLERDARPRLSGFASATVQLTISKDRCVLRTR